MSEEIVKVCKKHGALTIKQCNLNKRENDKVYYLCKNCASEWYKINKQNIRIRHKDYYKKNKDALKKRVKDYFLANREKIEERQRDYRIRNAGKKKIYNKNYQLKNKEKIKKRLLQNKEIIKKVRKSYYEKNREIILLNTKKWLVKNKDYYNNYCKNYQKIQRSNLSDSYMTNLLRAKKILLARIDSSVFEQLIQLQKLRVKYYRIFNHAGENHVR